MRLNIGGVIKLLPALLILAGTAAMADGHSARLTAALDAQSAEAKARYVYRHPAETLEFFGIKPGMTVVEGLPGRGWYTKILLPYLGDDGHIIGVAYSLDMYALFPFANEQFMARQRTWKQDWPAKSEEWGGGSGATMSAFHFGLVPPGLNGTADVVVFPRVLHNLARFQAQGKGNYLDVALADAYRLLKPGGIMGVVQHHARDEMPDEWATGANGYLKKQFVIEQMEAAGFEFVAASDINANPKDRPTTDDFVWRLPPSLVTSREDPELRQKMLAIGESNRMTLKFRKPR